MLARACVISLARTRPVPEVVVVLVIEAEGVWGEDKDRHAVEEGRCLVGMECGVCARA